MPKRTVDPRVIALAVGVPGVILLLVLVVSLRGDGSSDDDREAHPTTSTADAGQPTIDEDWNEDLAATVAPLGTVLVDLAATVDAWSTGAATDDELRTLLQRVDPVVATVRQAADALDAHPRDPLARPLVVGMADLYVAAVDAHRFALTATGDVRTQYDFLGRRLRILADRVFDRARERTAAAVDPGPDVSFVLPAEVPDWERLEIAAGPPLTAADSNRTDDLPLTREDDRAAQGEADWRGDVDAVDAPTVADVRSAIGDVDALGELARRLVAAAEALRAVPVPDGDRGRADRVALGWLVRADAARAAQLAALEERSGDDAGLVGVLLDVSASPALSPR